MTEEDAPQDLPEGPAPEPKAPPREKSASERRSEDLRQKEERVRKEAARDEVERAFGALLAFQKAVASATEAVDAALAAGAELEKRCQTRLGRNLHLARRLGVKASMGILVVARNQLRKSSLAMLAASRTREGVEAEAVDPGLDY